MALICKALSLILRVLCLLLILSPALVESLRNNYIGNQYGLKLERVPVPCPSFRLSYVSVNVVLNRVECDSNSRVPLAIRKTSKHGMVSLVLLHRLFWTDLTQHMDVKANPGRDITLGDQVRHEITDRDSVSFDIHKLGQISPEQSLW